MSLNTQYDNAEQSPGLLLWQITNIWQARQRAALKPFDLTHVQFVLLATLTYAYGTVTFTQKELAQYAQIDIMMTSQVIRKLEQKGLVMRTESVQDKRAIIVEPTQAGIELANEAVKAVEVVDEEFFGVLGADAPQFTHAMKILLAAGGPTL